MGQYEHQKDHSGLKNHKYLTTYEFLMITQKEISPVISGGSKGPQVITLNVAKYRERTKHLFCPPIWTVFQGNQIADVLINVEGMVKWENHHFAALHEIMAHGNAYQWL